MGEGWGRKEWRGKWQRKRGAYPSSVGWCPFSLLRLATRLRLSAPRFSLPVFFSYFRPRSDKGLFYAVTKTSNWRPKEQNWVVRNTKFVVGIDKCVSRPTILQSYSVCGRIFEPFNVFTQPWNVDHFFFFSLSILNSVKNMDPENDDMCFLPDIYLFILTLQCDNLSGDVSLTTTHDLRHPNVDTFSSRFAFTVYIVKNLVSLFSRKSLKILPTDVRFYGYNAPNSVCAYF